MRAARWDSTGTEKRLLDQYKASPNLIALFKALIDTPLGDIQLALESLYSRLAIDQSEGEQLDRIGDIVGAPRPLALVETALYLDDGEALEEEDDDGLYWGGDAVITDDGSARKLMNDEDYRLFLRAIIFQNTSGSSVPELERFTTLLLDEPVSILDALGTIDFQFYQPLSTRQQVIIRETFKVAAGVRARYFTYSGGPGGFGFDGGPNTGFDDTSGAGFARIFEGQ